MSTLLEQYEHMVITSQENLQNSPATLALDFDEKIISLFSEFSTLVPAYAWKSIKPEYSINDVYQFFTSDKYDKCCHYRIVVSGVIKVKWNDGSIHYEKISREFVSHSKNPDLQPMLIKGIARKEQDKVQLDIIRQANEYVTLLLNKSYDTQEYLYLPYVRDYDDGVTYTEGFYLFRDGIIFSDDPHYSNYDSVLCKMPRTQGDIETFLVKQLYRLKHLDQ